MRNVKKLWVLTVALSFLVVSGTQAAEAPVPPQAETVPSVSESQPEAVRIWKESLSEMNLPKFIMALHERGMITDGRIHTGGLGKIAYLYAQSKGYLQLVPVSARTEAGYVAMFLRWNGVAKKNTITTTELLQIGNRRGWWLPITEGVGAQMRILREAHHALQREVSGLQGGDQQQLQDYAARLEMIGGKTDKLSQSVATLQSIIDGFNKGQLSEAALAKIKESTLAELEPQLQALATANAAQDSVIARNSDALARIDADLAEMRGLVNPFGYEFVAAVFPVAIVEKFVRNPWVAYIALLLIMLAVSLLTTGLVTTLVQRRYGKRVTKRFADVDGNHQNLVTQVDSLQQRVTKLEVEKGVVSAEESIPTPSVDANPDDFDVELDPDYLKIPTLHDRHKKSA